MTGAAHSLGSGVTPGFVVGMVVFGIALAVLVVVVVRWAVVRDRHGRAEWERRRLAEDPDGPAPARRDAP